MGIAEIAVIVGFSSQIVAWTGGAPSPDSGLEFSGQLIGRHRPPEPET